MDVICPKSDKRIDYSSHAEPGWIAARLTSRLPDFGNNRIYLTLGALPNSRRATGRNQCKQSGGVSAWNV